jgi:ATP-dependent RNA helicase DDX42
MTLCRWLEENPTAGNSKDEDEDDLNVEYDADGNPIAPEKIKYIDPLPPINHSDITYHSFEKNFYEEHEDIVGLNNIQIIDLQQKLNVKVSGPSPPKPVTSFAHFGFDDALMKAIR